jgi:phytoene dehydrogenase-like protein
MKSTAIIIGGGLAGLSAARQLHAQGIDFKLFEATERIGGRVKTEVVNGFRLDRGFQVLLTEYPEAKRWLDYKKLALKSFTPGALLLLPGGKKSHIGDPLRDFSSLLPTLFSSTGNLMDKLRILKLKTRLAKLTIEEIFQQKEKTTLEALSGDYGFSNQMIEQFFTPFFAGIFLEKKLTTSRRMFDFVFKMFGEADTAIPNLGMEEIPKLLAQPLPENLITTNARVLKIENQTVYLEDGSAFSAPNIIVATEATSFVKELERVKTRYQSTTHLHFIAEIPPLKKPIIALNTNKERLANNICTISQVASGYAPVNKSLVSISVVGKSDFSKKEIVKAIRSELKTWFGKAVEDWEHLDTKVIEYALPNQSNVHHEISKQDFKIRKGLYLCGDFQLNGSINAAMKSGREVAELVTKDLV